MRSAHRAVAVCSLAPLVAMVAGGRDEGSGINGRVVPCGIVLERPASCAVPSKRASTIIVGQRQHVVRRAKVRAGGSFRVRLDAGRYWLQARTGGMRGPRTRATVSQGQWTTVTLVAGRIAPPRSR